MINATSSFNLIKVNYKSLQEEFKPNDWNNLNTTFDIHLRTITPFTKYLAKSKISNLGLPSFKIQNKITNDTYLICKLDSTGNLKFTIDNLTAWSILEHIHNDPSSSPFFPYLELKKKILSKKEKLKTSLEKAKSISLDYTQVDPLLSLGACVREEVSISYKELCSIFGKPNCKGDKLKVTTEWVLKDMQTEGIVTIYDYKSTNYYDESLPSLKEFLKLDTYSWHIGSKNKKDALRLGRYIKTALTSKPIKSSIKLDLKRNPFSILNI